MSVRDQQRQITQLANRLVQYAQGLNSHRLRLAQACADEWQDYLLDISTGLTTIAARLKGEAPRSITPPVESPDQLMRIRESAYIVARQLRACLAQLRAVDLRTLRTHVAGTIYASQLTSILRNYSYDGTLDNIGDIAVEMQKLGESVS